MLSITGRCANELGPPMLIDPFLKEHRQPGKLLKHPLRSYLRDLLLIVCIIFFRPSYPLFFAGTALFLLGLGIRLWAKGILHRNESVTLSGPYSFCRHPFYLGNLILDLSFCLMAGNWILFLLYTPVFLFVYTSTMQEEEDFLLDKFPEEYPRILHLSRLCPRLPKGTYQPGHWSLHTLLREREISRLFRILGIACFFGWFQLLRHVWWEAVEYEGLIILISAILLQLLSRLIYVSLERAKVHTRSSKRLAVNTLIIAVFLTGCLTTDAFWTSQPEMEHLLRTTNSRLITSHAQLADALSVGSSSFPVLVDDDVLEKLPPMQAKMIHVQKAYLLDWEIYLLLVRKNS